tara:strand:- start:477 stop:908 length:432 start_codon:yes stop_codon:yes gene_type:complete
MSNDVLIFRSSRFSLDPPRDHRGILPDCPLGDDIAAFFATELPKQYPQWSCGEPKLEDSWSSLDCQQDERTLALVFTYFPAAEIDDQWAVQFTPHTGIFWFLRRRRPDLLADLVACVSQIVDSHPEAFDAVRWASEAEFLAAA